MKTLVVGGGPAGLACAVELAAAGLTVEVLEAAPVLGGKVASWQDADGDHVETGLHIFFGGYTHLRAVMARAGIAEHIAWKAHEIVVARTGGHRHRLRFPPLPAPLDGLAAFATTDLLSPADRLRLLRGILPAWRGGLAYARAADRLTYADWHRRRGMSAATLERLWGPICRATGFLGAEESSARPLVTVFRHFARRGGASRVGFLRGAPAEYLHGPLARFVEAHGGRVRTDCAVTRLLLHEAGGRVRGVALASGEVRAADTVVLAVPLTAAQRLLPSHLRAAEALAGLWRLRAAPVISVQLWYDRPLPTEDNLVYTPDACFPVWADLARTSPASYGGRGAVIAACVAPAAPLIEEPDALLIERVRAELAALLPGARVARVVKSHLLRLPDAIYRQAPGTDALRPGVQTPVANLFLAGCYTRQDYMASIEGAVRSGRRAAAAVRALAGSVAVGQAVPVTAGRRR